MAALYQCDEKQTVIKGWSVPSESSGASGGGDLVNYSNVNVDRGTATVANNADSMGDENFPALVSTAAGIVIFFVTYIWFISRMYA